MLSPAQGRKGEAFQWSPRPVGRPCRRLHPRRLQISERGAWKGRVARGHDSRRLVAPGVTSHGRGRPPDTPPVPDHSPHPAPPAPSPKRGSPGRGRSGSLAAPSGGGRGWGAVPWAKSRAQKQGIPQRGPNPARGWACTKGDLFFLGMPAPSQTYLQPHSGDRLHPHMAAQTRRGRQQRGCRQPQRSAVKKNLAPTTPCYRLNIIYLTPSNPK